MDRRNFLKTASIASAASLVGGYSVFLERYLVQVNKYKIPLPRLPASFEGFTIVHLTDIHYGPLTPLWFLEKIFARVSRIPCDMIVCTGDYIIAQSGHDPIDTIWPVLAKLRAPAGVLSVLGNHDHDESAIKSLQWLKRAGQDLRHCAKPVVRNGERLWFVGAGDLWYDHVPIEELTADIPRADCRIVLAHNPDSADTVRNAAVDLFVCGHTHGGQVDIPLFGPPFLSVKNRNYSSGLKRSEQGAPVFISRGIGWAIFPIRFNCPPEIAVLTLTRGHNG